MKKNIQRAKKQLQEFRSVLGGKIKKKKGVFTLLPDSDKAAGFAKCISFNKCMHATLIDINGKEDLSIPISNSGTDVVYFLYSLEGVCYLQTGENNDTLILNELQSAATYCETDCKRSIEIPAGPRRVVNLIGINKACYEKEYNNNFRGLNGKLQKLFDMVYQQENRSHLGKYNLKIGEYVKDMFNSRWENEISTYLYFEGLNNLILASQIDQFYKELEHRHSETSLTHDELKRIREVSEYIRNYPEVHHSIRALSKKAGLSASKLQEGFKLMHQRTVSDHVRQVRLEKAEELIKRTDLNISEIVYSIGLTSRSYFCKIFKKRFGCSPKQYQKNAVDLAMSL